MPIEQNDTAPTNDFPEPPTLPPALYWSPSLAHRLNLMFEAHTLHGLIDATGSIFMCWVDDGWEVLRGNDLPGDALRLVCDTVSAP